MFRRAYDAADEMANSLEIEAALHFAIDHLAHQGRLASLLSNRAAPECLALCFAETNGKGAPHVKNLPLCKTDCKTNGKLKAETLNRACVSVLSYRGRLGSRERGSAFAKPPLLKLRRARGYGATGQGAEGREKVIGDK